MRAKRKKGRPPSVLSFKVPGMVRSARRAAVAKQSSLSSSLAELSSLGGSASGSPLQASDSPSLHRSGPPFLAGSVLSSGLGGSPSTAEHLHQVALPSVASLVIPSVVTPACPVDGAFVSKLRCCGVAAPSSPSSGSLLLGAGSTCSSSLGPSNGSASTNHVLSGVEAVAHPTKLTPVSSVSVPVSSPLPDSSLSAPDCTATAPVLSPPPNGAVNQVQNFASLLKSSIQLQVLGSPSEHVSGAPFVLIPDENIEAAKLEFKDYVYARFHGDFPSMGKIIGVVNAVWAKTGPRIFVHNIGQGIYLLRVTNSRARDVLLSRTCWNIGGLPMFVAPWSPEYSREEPPLTSATVPIELRNVPYLLFNREILSRIATAVGKPESLFPETERKENFAVAKLYVKVDLTAPLPNRIISGFSNGKEVQIDVSYPWLPVKCEACKKFGHNKDKCNVRTPKDSPVGLSGNRESFEKVRRRSKSRPGRSTDKKDKKVEVRYVPVLREGDAVTNRKSLLPNLAMDQENTTLEEGEIVGVGAVGPDTQVTSAALVQKVIPETKGDPQATPLTCAISDPLPTTIAPDTSPGSHQPVITQSCAPSPSAEANQCLKLSNTIDDKNIQNSQDTTEIDHETADIDTPQPAGELESEKPFFLVKNRKSGRKVTNRH
ncbi:hypothetical protein N665_0841s0008 [Sinapis alba]|nr:hypothetical protein N665_0841s0008 [Sinapis alba]